MADKPRLKDSDEILSALRGGKPKAPPLPTISGRDLPDAPELPPEPAPVPEPVPQMAEPVVETPPPDKEKKTVKRRRKRQPQEGTAQPEPSPAVPAEPIRAPEPVISREEEGDEDSNPLDFGKYSLPETTPPSEPNPRRAASRRGGGAPRSAASAPSTKPEPPVAQGFAPVEPKSSGTEPEQVFTDQGPKLIQPYQFEDLSTTGPIPEPPSPPVAVPVPEPEPDPEPEPKPKPRARSRAKAKADKPPVEEQPQREEPKPDPQPEPEPQKEPEPEPDPREKFIQELSSQFDKAFNKRFEGRGDDYDQPQPARKEPEPGPFLPKEQPASRKPETKPDPEPDPQPDPQPEPQAAPESGPSAGQPRRRRRPDLRFTPKEQPRPKPARVPEPEPEPDPEPELPEEILPERETDPDREADSFLEQFSQQVREEEEERTEEFKDTLARKFERERQRYLQELGIPDPDDEEDARQEDQEEEEEPAGFVPPKRRKLDLRIQPEMHNTPVTYSRSGELRPMDEDPEEQEDLLDQLEAEAAFREQGREPDPQPESTGPKTPEELLLELGAQNTMRRINRHRPQARPQQAHAHKHLNFTPQEEDLPERTGFLRRHRVAAVFTLAALILLVGVSLVVYFLQRGAPPVGSVDGWPGVSEDADGTLVVRETRNPDVREEHNDVLVKRSNISVSNMTVNNLLVIEDIPSAGRVHLENISVAGAIYLNNCAVDALSLHNVSATRLVITNDETDVTLDISGAGLIQTLELRSAATVTAVPLQGSETMGVRDLLIRQGEGTGSLSVALSGMDLTTLSSYGQTVLNLSADSFVEAMNVEGSLSMRGGGRVLSLTAGPDESGHMTLSLEEGNVTRLHLKGTASINLAGQVDSLTAADDLTLVGAGRVVTMTVNARVGGGRILADLSGVEVSALVANTEARVSAAGGARVYELTANDSVYALGNKVNTLIVNADNVIYENEPDRIIVASGVRQPESMADNPNLDYSLSAEDNQLPLQAEDDGLATLCGHTRENGAFTAGDGSRANPYEVATAAQLAHISTHLDSHFVQVADIDISDDTRFITGFDMIAGNGVPFSGSYDGNGFEIRNLRISSAAENVGLFAESIGTIQHVTISSGEVRSTADNSRAFVGGVVGLNYQGGVVEACSNGARVIGNNDSSYVGGVAGYNFGGRVRNCYNAARISGTANVGGVVGVNRDDAMVSGCYSVGIIEGTYESGAVVGINSGGIVTNCYYLVETADSGIGSGAGTATAKTAGEFESAQMVADLAAGSDATPWTVGSGSYVYPTLRKPEQGSLVETLSGLAGSSTESGVSGGEVNLEPEIVDEE